ncbi:MAG TPA: hypothetical protein VFG90_10155 [Nitrososphaeraceae archaeon]|nr:hypothetical protein [Nitrososphaeraceae archaeon]
MGNILGELNLIEPCNQQSVRMEGDDASSIRSDMRRDIANAAALESVTLDLNY